MAWHDNLEDLKARHEAAVIVREFAGRDIDIGGRDAGLIKQPSGYRLPPGSREASVGHVHPQEGPPPIA